MSVKISTNGGRFASSVVLQGTLDASLASNLPLNPKTGDRYRITTAGSFENDASILPAQSYFSEGDQIEWDGISSNWIKLEAGDNILDTAFGAGWDGDVNNAPTRNAVFDKATAQDLAHSNHLADVANPHAVTKAQVGLGTVTDDPQLKIASNLSDLNDVATARTNISVDSVAEADAKHALNLKIASDLSDLNDTTTARTNLDVDSKAETKNKAIKYSIALG